MGQEMSSFPCRMLFKRPRAAVSDFLEGRFQFAGSQRMLAFCNFLKYFSPYFKKFKPPEKLFPYEKTISR